MNSFKYKFRKRTGVAAVEMALCLPFILIVLIGILEFYRIVQFQQILHNAAREGCRIAGHGFTTGANGLAKPIMIQDVKNTVLSSIFGYWNVNHDFDLNQFNQTTTITFAQVDTNNNVISTSKHPFQLSKGEKFMVEVTTPYSNILLTNFGIGVIFPLASLKAKSTMICLSDKDVSITPSQTLMPKSFQ